MDRPTDAALDDDADAPQFLVRMSEPGELAAALPYLLGFRPTESVVLVAMGGASGGRLGLTVRIDLPPPEHAAAAARGVARGIATDRPAAVVAFVVSESPDVPAADPGQDGPAADLPHRSMVHEVLLALAALDIPVHDAMLVRDGRWWSYECPHACCAPGAGTPLPGGVSELEVASVATGHVVEPDRDRLGARIAPLTGAAADAMAETVARVGVHYARDSLTDDARAERLAWSVIRRAVRRCRPGAGSAAVRLPSREVARVLWALTDLRVRDRALGLALGRESAAAEVLWTECTRRAPEPLRAAPVTLLAVSAWLRGDGAMANVALDRALDSDPDYRLAALLSQGLAACVRPAELRATIRETVAGLHRLGR